MGGMNYHIIITFEDDVEWTARIRRFNATSPPAPLRDYILRSEVATLKFLEGTAVPAPKVFEYAFEDASNSVGVGYILQEKVPGRSLQWSSATAEQRRKVMEQLADIYIELSRHPLELLGSLDRPGSSHVGAFAKEELSNLTSFGFNYLARSILGKSIMRPISG